MVGRTKSKPSKKVARPRKRPSDKRTRSLQVMLTESEYSELKQHAHSLGINLASWARLVLFRELRKDAHDGPQRD